MKLWQWFVLFLLLTAPFVLLHWDASVAEFQQDRAALSSLLGAE